MNKYILAIDQGTTSTRAILYDSQVREIAKSQKEFKQYYPSHGSVEHDANEIWLTTLSVIADCIISSGIQPREVAAIGITNQRETTVVWDKKSGLPVHKAICWQSRQTTDICEKIRNDGYEQIIMSKTGLVINPYFSASKIKYILDHIENGYERAKNGELAFGTIDSFLIWKLSGGKDHVTDVSNASRTQLFNINTLSWDDELLSIFGIPKEILPKVVDSSGYISETADYHFFGENIPITGVAGDQQAALFGQKCFNIGTAKNTYGTGCFTLMNTGDKIVYSDKGLLTTVGWKIGSEVVYAMEGSVFIGGSIVQWLRDELKIIDSSSQCEEVALTVPDSGGMIIIPAFVGLGTPYWCDKARGTIFGLTRGTNKGHFVRACLEAIALEVNDIINAMKDAGATNLTLLKADGGASSNNLLMQMQADILNTNVERYASESTALGVAYLAGLGIGLWKNKDSLPDPLVGESIKTFTPDGDETYLLKLKSRWSKAISIVKDSALLLEEE